MKLPQDLSTNAPTRFVCNFLTCESVLMCDRPQVVNVTKCDIKQSALGSIFPTGDYKMIFHFDDENGYTFGKTTIVASVLSSDKNSFG